MKEYYPRPQFGRTKWLCLNGTWEYETDRAKSGYDRKLWEKSAHFSERIEVPFCRESVLSGIGDTDFCECVWYRKRVQLQEGWQKTSERLILHFGACDYRTQVWVNGERIGYHIGGYTSFYFDITKWVSGLEFTVTVCAEDDIRTHRQPAGKQSTKYGSYGCSYTRVTGIWQTVWLEAVPDAYIHCAKFYPDIDSQILHIDLRTVKATGMKVTARASYKGRTLGVAEATVGLNGCRIILPLSELHLWEVGKGELYDLTLRMGEDEVRSYFGMRRLEVRNGVLYLNRKPIFQRLVLDQGYYPDGIYTAPTEEKLMQDIILAQEMGFNGARLHQKLFEPRFLYHCDRLGYLVWEEYADWGLDLSCTEVFERFLPEWMEVLERDFNHPSIVGWCPLNETSEKQNLLFVRTLANLTRAIDPTRLYIEASGWSHVEGLADLLDYHYYESNPDAMRRKLAPLINGEKIRMDSPYTSSCMEGYPTFISEFGGIRWTAEKGHSWGYGVDPQTEEEFFERFEGQVDTLLENPAIGGFCYTQLYDVEQEQNGLCTYDRVPKFDTEKFRRILSRPAAVETIECGG